MFIEWGLIIFRRKYFKLPILWNKRNIVVVSMVDSTISHLFGLARHICHLKCWLDNLKKIIIAPHFSLYPLPNSYTCYCHRSPITKSSHLLATRYKLFDILNNSFLRENLQNFSLCEQFIDLTRQVGIFESRIDAHQRRQRRPLTRTFRIRPTRCDIMYSIAFIPVDGRSNPTIGACGVQTRRATWYHARVIAPPIQPYATTPQATSFFGHDRNIGQNNVAEWALGQSVDVKALFPALDVDVRDRDVLELRRSRIIGRSVKWRADIAGKIDRMLGGVVDFEIVESDVLYEAQGNVGISNLAWLPPRPLALLTRIPQLTLFSVTSWKVTFLTPPDISLPILMAQ